MDQHLDPERLSAFMEGALPPAERAAVEAHAAGCTRCLELLATMARTEPPRLEQPRAWSMVLRWGVPLAAGATALALYVNVDRRTPAAVDEREAATAAVERPAPGAAPPPAAPRETDRQASRAAAPPTVAKKIEPPPAGARKAETPPPAPADEAFRARPVGETAPSAGAADPGASAEQRAAGALADTARRQAAEQAPPAALPAPTAVVRPDGLAETVTTSRLLVLEFSSPGGAARWRVRGTVAERSLDGGRTWTPAGRLPGFVLAGHSPSPAVAWLAGLGGTVLRTTNAGTWERLPFPAAVDLREVAAASDLEATVTATDGRAFRTTDGGRTWALQEPPASPF